MSTAPKAPCNMRIAISASSVSTRPQKNEKTVKPQIDVRNSRLRPKRLLSQPVAGNTMAQTVRERKEEIGVLKAIGYSHRHVMGLVLTESIVLAGGAGLVGLALAWFAIAQGDPTGGAFPIFYFPTPDILLGVLLAITLGVTAGLLPAAQAMRLQVAEALRRK